MLYTAFPQWCIKHLSARLHYCAVPAVLLLAACATPMQQHTDKPLPAIAPVAVPAAITAEENALRNLASLQGRLERVAAPLLVKNATLCKGHARNLLGFSAKNKYSYSAELADAVQTAFGFDDRLQITNVLAGSGAANAGVQRGDIILAVNDKPIPQGENANGMRLPC